MLFYSPRLAAKLSYVLAYLCDQLRSSITKRDTIMRKAISTERRVAITLWFLSTGSDCRTIGHLFSVSKSAVCIVTKEVYTTIVECLLPKYVKIPVGAALRENVEAFKTKLCYPQCVGAVDGTCIPIISPQECPADYNRKGWHSIILQGTVDHAGRFIDIHVTASEKTRHMGYFVKIEFYVWLISSTIEL